MSVHSEYYASLTDEELDAKIDSLREKYEELITGGVVTVIAKAGRRMEFNRAGSGELKKLLDAALDARAVRKNKGQFPGRAIGVSFQ